MGQSGKIKTAVLFVIIVAVTAQHLYAASDNTVAPENVPAYAQAAPAGTQTEADARMNRIDFGNTYIIGQSIKSGAVYLLQRKKSEINSMLKYRENYREEILEGFTVDSDKSKVREQGQQRSADGGRQTVNSLVSQD